MYYRVERHNPTHYVCPDECPPYHWWGFYCDGGTYENPLPEKENDAIKDVSDSYPATYITVIGEQRHWFTEWGWAQMIPFHDIIRRYGWVRLRTAKTLEVIYEDEYQVIGIGEIDA